MRRLMMRCPFLRPKKTVLYTSRWKERNPPLNPPRLGRLTLMSYV